MKGLAFADEAELRVALGAGWVPAYVASAPARVVRTEDSLVIVPSVAVPVAALAKLAEVGIAAVPARGGATVPAWAAAMRSVRVPDAGLDAGTVVFLVPRAGALVSLAAELLRLGCDRLEARLVGERALVRVVAPPFHTTLRALDRSDGLRGYRAVGDVLVELGWEHPLARAIRPAAGDVVLVSPDAWETLPDAPFDDLLPRLELTLPGPTRSVPTRSELPRVVAPLVLTRASRRAAASLWLVAGTDAVADIAGLVRSSPDDVVAAYLFAVTDETRPRVFLRAKPGAHVADPGLGVPAFAAHPRIPHLFVPADAALEPPLRADRLRELLAPDPAVLVLVTREAVLHIPEDAFRPLSSFVDYRVDAEVQTLCAWIESTTFDLAEHIVDRGRAHGEDDDAREDASAHRGDKREKTEPARPRPRRTPTVTAHAPAPPVAAPVVITTAPPTELARALADAEHELLAAGVPLDDPSNVARWMHLAELSAALGRDRDAAHAFIRAIWEAPEDEAVRIAERWSALEGASDLNATFAKSGAAPREVRAVVATAIARPESVADAAGFVRFLDAHDTALDVRSTWAARAAVAGRSGDALMLARARDRVLARLARGLSVERDVPTFLRFAGRTSDSTARLSSALDAMAERAPRVHRARSPLEAPPELTRGYVDLTIAWGLASLGASDRARSLGQAALARLPTADAVHGVLTRAFSARIEQALAGGAADAPLPSAVATELNALDKFLRYKVDRLRQASSVLEPVERLDPIGAYQRDEADPRGAAFAPLRAETDPDVLADALAPLLDAALDAPPAARARVFDAALDFLPQLSEPRAVPLLDRVLSRLGDLEPVARVQLYEESLRVAGHFGDAPRARAILAALVPVVRAFDPSSASVVTQLVARAVRALRRVGLRDEAGALLDAASALAGGEEVASSIAAAHVAAGLALLDREADARPRFERALARLDAEVAMPDRLALTRAVARGVATCHADYALAVLERLFAQLGRVSDSYNTNSHFCLSVVAFVDALVVGYASPDLALGETSRRIFDEDEHLVRRRIHREARG